MTKNISIRPAEVVIVFTFSRVVHGFTSCGILESQYQGFAEAAKIGNVGDKYVDYGELFKCSHYSYQRISIFH